MAELASAFAPSNVSVGRLATSAARALPKDGRPEAAMSRLKTMIRSMTITPYWRPLQVA
jgi:hypothetical protein